MTLPAEELELLREEVQTWYEDLVDIYEYSIVDDAYGGESPTEIIHATGIPCLIDSGAAHEQTRAMLGKLVGVQLFTVTLPAGTHTELGWHLTVTTRSNRHLRIQAILYPESLEIERQVIASEEREEHIV